LTLQDEPKRNMTEEKPQGKAAAWPTNTHRDCHQIRRLSH
jgi:hypothetical protein